LPFFRCRNAIFESSHSGQENFPMDAIEKPAQRPQGAARSQSLTGVRLRKHADYQRAYAAGRKRQSQSMSWFLAPQQTDGPHAPAGPRVGLTAGKVLGKAHERNRIKRRVREVLRRHAEMLPAGFDLILHPRRAVLTMEFAKLEAEVLRILNVARGDMARGEMSSRDRSRGPQANAETSLAPASAVRRNLAKPAQ
jgi:ribonuclease P protein component